MYIYRTSVFCRSIGGLLRNKEKLEETIRDIIAQSRRAEFLLKSETKEDISAAFAVKAVTREYEIERANTTLVLPYVTEELFNPSELFDNIEVSSNTILEYNLPDRESRDKYMEKNCECTIVITSDDIVVTKK